jgi:hypothetical protein
MFFEDGFKENFSRTLKLQNLRTVLLFDLLLSGATAQLLPESAFYPPLRRKWNQLLYATSTDV